MEQVVEWEGDLPLSYYWWSGAFLWYNLTYAYPGVLPFWDNVAQWYKLNSRSSKIMKPGIDQCSHKGMCIKVFWFIMGVAIAQCLPLPPKAPVIAYGSTL